MFQNVFLSPKAQDSVERDGPARVWLYDSLHVLDLAVAVFARGKYSGLLSWSVSDALSVRVCSVAEYEQVAARFMATSLLPFGQSGAHHVCMDARELIY